MYLYPIQGKNAVVPPGQPLGRKPGKAFPPLPLKRRGFHGLKPFFCEAEAIARLECSPQWLWVAMAQRVVYPVAQVLAPDCASLFLTDGFREYMTATAVSPATPPRRTLHAHRKNAPQGHTHAPLLRSTGVARVVVHGISPSMAQTLVSESG